ncbi:hypothetical protein BEP19_04200 [Ammoniphilus oxalaticus]|uniref:Uncharacterized protein n=1 Tax=Ammoniphilus oxalaticus TaxID=66863 RepID=A0A419SLZ3_9BACL|nr:hypothetical protein [Ammoniphilus oxalaticus]RKD25035.1 hypothetical protein BEP19_04200 [Ammoniphilus oxalaticus]
MIRSIWIVSAVFLLLVGCQDQGQGPGDLNPIKQSGPQAEIDGVEMKLELDKATYAEDEMVVAVVTITNHNDESQPITLIVDDGLAWESYALAQHQAEKWFGNFQAVDKIEGKQGGGSDNTRVYTLEPNEILEQHFEWDQRVTDFVIDYESDLRQQQIPGPTGKYDIKALVMIGDVTAIPGGNVDEMTQQFDALPQLAVQSSVEILGDRKVMGSEQAKALVLADKKAGEWYRAHSYEELVWKRRGDWYQKDVDGSDVKITKEMAEQLKGLAPRLAGGKRTDDTLTLEYGATLGDAPHSMIVEIDTVKNNVAAVTFKE